MLMEVVVLIMAVGAMCCTCFFIGAKVGQTVSKGEDVKALTINPLEAYRKHEERKKAQAEQERNDIILQNIEAYDGTGMGQRDVPRG